MKYKSASAVPLAVVSALLAYALPASAAAPAVSELEEVIVTADRRDQRLQDVPSAVTAISAESLLERGANDFGSYFRTVPGAALAELGTQGNEVKLRGVGNGTAQLSPTTAVYFGDVPVISTGPSINSSYNFRLVDMERIEVLRGPQGQLYGANSLGGAIKNIPHEPDMKSFGATVSGSGFDTQGGAGSYDGDASVNIPIIAGVLAARVAGYYSREGGWFDNVYKGGVPLISLVPPGPPIPPPLWGPAGVNPLRWAFGITARSNPAIGAYTAPANNEQDVNSQDVKGARVILRWIPSDRLSADLTVVGEQKHTAGTTWATDIPNNPLGKLIPPLPPFPPGPGPKIYPGLPGGFSGPPTVGVPNTTTASPIRYLYPTSAANYQQANGLDAKANDKIFLASLAVDYDLGFSTLRGLVAHWDRTEALDTDLGIFGYIYTGVFAEVPTRVHREDNPKNTIEELRLTSKSQGPLTWIAGLYHEKVDQSYTALTSDLSGLDIFYHIALTQAAAHFGPPPTTPLMGLQDEKYTDEQYAAYGELAYDLTSTFNAALSFRGFTLDQTAKIVNSGFQYAGQPNTDRKHNDHIFTPKLNLSWKPTKDQLYYVTAAEGYRTGITNNDVPLNLCTAELAAAGSPAGLQPTRPDKLWNYELGAKMAFADRRVTVNGAIYHIDWSNLQSQVIMSGLAPIPQASRCNFPAIFNVGKATIEGLELEVNALLSNHLRLDWSFASTNPRYESNYPALGIVKGAKMQGTPDLQSTLGLQYGFELAQRSGFARVDWSYTGRVPNAGNDFRTQAAPFQSGDFHTVNARLGMDITREFRIELFADNLLNEFGVQRQIDVNGGQAPTVFTIRPRTLGATVRISY